MLSIQKTVFVNLRSRLQASRSRLKSTSSLFSTKISSIQNKDIIINNNLRLYSSFVDDSDEGDTISTSHYDITKPRSDEILVGDFQENLTDVISVSPNATVGDCVQKLIVEQVSCLIVKTKVTNEVTGICTVR